MNTCLVNTLASNLNMTVTLVVSLQILPVHKEHQVFPVVPILLGPLDAVLKGVKLLSLAFKVWY